MLIEEKGQKFCSERETEELGEGRGGRATEVLGKKSKMGDSGGGGGGEWSFNFLYIGRKVEFSLLFLLLLVFPSPRHYLILTPRIRDSYSCCVTEKSMSNTLSNG